MTTAAWAAGDYGRVAAVLEPASHAVVEAAAIGSGDRVLDVAAGTGNLALSAARAGARVIATDITPELIEIGRARTKDAGVEWAQADAQALPYEDGAFDCAASVFGMIFAPDPERAAAELFRVVRPGGRVALTAWVPVGWNGEFMRLLGEATAMPPGVAIPPDWGREDVLRGRLEPHSSRVDVHDESIDWPGETPEELCAFVEEAVPPLVAARAALDGERYATLRQGLLAALREHGPRAPYLLAVASVP